ncbi:DUF397 domain-containing protein [Nocardia sp. NBC_01503]|uniref:DUF397 domain-containing protein n=1 Tax=Nocardia sp. NBC_01503 TaxID=2975997 RepID=UPI002E7ADDFF|nr:DUF397 domain-containing protein [Nocardia sp. NBC_01503]WTL32682.1 DUF397 domain-containing protein [Nocardia sp. NBC_01503]
MNDLAEAHWFKSSRSQGGEACVEAAHLRGGSVGVRDSKLGTTSPVLIFDGSVWDRFNDAVKSGHFDCL